MTDAFARIAFTPNVQAVQTRMGSREAYARHMEAPPTAPRLGPYEIAFIASRDSCYMGTVSETGWPYVQHRGGPAGFLKVLDDRTIGYADFSGNRQYVSVGNLVGDDRVSLFLMDYPQQARLKIFGRARVIDEDSEPELLTRLDNPHYRARVERGIVIRIEGFDWNCPKYITPRYTEAQMAERMAQTIAARAAEVVEISPPPETPIGEGTLTLTVSGMRQMTPRIRAYELRADAPGTLPPAEPGAHLEVPVRLADGAIVTRQYSLVADPEHPDRYEIAVLHEDDGRGGSSAIHDAWGLGTTLRVAPPINHFPLHTDNRPAVLIAGGIGITPILSMAHALKHRGVPFELHYSGRTAADMAYHDQIVRELAAEAFIYLTRVPGHRRLDVDAVLLHAASDAVFYVCGPGRLIDTVTAAARRQSITPERIQHESFD
ncbi:pyridoxamine 5'-phosphate oxidase family protein [Denitromonas iodatirespirans]|uniref:Pyridoxamine 5'-phosphate oxidase family protein n=1 Tax=Denitromonas iodatirespirans TaxID=2795389 RepID=A0A944HCB4_DENI1|nr:pyridoxamine 5'-phosphate oxidase family protein [Denitromonas iodatirespirans]MBT0962542.1 pyridoxamine 5'-phosphate oxidase family protein [Denitromonas iodatirespirans]